MVDIHWPQKMVWHGADEDGVRARSSYCEAWHSDSVTNVGLASDVLKNHELMDQQKVGCNNKLIVLCIEIASQHQYRRRRRDVQHGQHNNIEENDDDLTFEQYTQFIDEQYI